MMWHKCLNIEHTVNTCVASVFINVTETINQSQMLGKWQKDNEMARVIDYVSAQTPCLSKSAQVLQ